jgi:hypothetical protein
MSPIRVCALFGLCDKSWTSAEGFAIGWGCEIPTVFLILLIIK